MSWVEGLLGAVMGGAQEYGTVLKEEETAKRKEEEEKRREERALTLAERKADAEQKRKLALEAEERKRVAGMMGPETRMTPAASPMEPEGIVESQIPAEERLQAGIQKALSQGDTKAAKSFLEQYQGLEEIKRKAAEEARKAEPKKEEPSAEFKTRMATIQAAYPGKKDESGNPVDKEDYDKYVRAEFGKLAAKEAYIRPERGIGGASGPAGQRPPTSGQLMAAEYKIGSKLKESFTEGTGDKKRVNQDLVNRAELVAINLIDNSDPTKRLDVLKIQNDAVAQVRAAKKKAEEQAGAQWDAMKDKGGVTRSRYIERNYMDYIDDYLGKAQEPAAPSAGAPWTRSWRQ